MSPNAVDVARAFDLAIDASPHGLLVEDSGTIVVVNRALERQFGYSRDELLGEVIDLILPDAARGSRDVCGRRKDGSRVDVQIEWRPLQTSDSSFRLATVTETSGRQRGDDRQGEALRAQFAFERFVNELTTQFINLPADQRVDALTAGLRRSCAQLGVDRATLYRIGPDHAPFASVSWTVPSVASRDAALPTKDRFPWSLARLLGGEVVSFSLPDEVPDPIDRASYIATPIKSAFIVPLSVEGRVCGAFSVSAVQTGRTWPAGVTCRIGVLATTFAQVLAQLQREEAMQAAAAEARRLKEQLEMTTVSVRRDVRNLLGRTRIVGKSASVQAVLEKVHQVATMDSTVLLLGETGTGKELFASHIHEASSRNGRQMVRVNCAAIPTTLIESELFGREKGAFTGSLARQVGRFEMADHSTLFLDEIGDLPAEVQVKLLRVLEERKFERLGSPRSIAVDTRIIAATHRNLEALMAAGTFREDLYYRLSVFPVHVPPLRERVEDIPLLVWRFVEEFAKAFGKRVDSIDAESIAALQQYSWPGNIRELRNVVERAMIVSTSPRLSIGPPLASSAAARRSPKLIDVEKEHIRTVVEGTGWRIRGVGGAAERLGLRPTTLETRMAKLGLRRPQPDAGTRNEADTGTSGRP